jgi:hypothetical protein
MSDLIKPPSITEREVSDMVKDLRISEKKQGVCEDHPLLVRSAVLGHRQSEQIDFKVSQIQMQMEILMADRLNPTPKDEQHDRDVKVIHDEDEKHFRFAVGKLFKGDFEGFGAGSICMVIFVLFLSIGMFANIYNNIQMSKRMDVVTKSLMVAGENK